jgi:anti-sigma factor ChrR (cupin superfamily)
MYTCGEIEELLDIYTDSELDEGRRPIVESHLLVCPHCSRLARLREIEARLVRSSVPVPALSVGFTGQVMSNLSRDGHTRGRGERFFPLNRVFARPWLAPAVAGLLLLVTVSWAVSGRLAALNPKLALNNALNNDRQETSQVLPASPDTPAADSNNEILHDSAATGISSGVSPGPAQLSPGSEPTADSKANSKDAAGAEKGRVAYTLPQESRGVGATSSDAGSALSGNAPELRMMSLPPQQVSYEQISYDKLEQQGYTVFEPGYLPPGYSLQPYIAQPQDQGGNGEAPAATLAVKNSLLLAYRNDQAGEAITLEIMPLSEPSSPPAPEPDQTLGAAGAPEPDKQTEPAGDPVGQSDQSDVVNQITWTVQKNGGDFMLKLAGGVIFEELDRVKASIK